MSTTTTLKSPFGCTPEPDQVPAPSGRPVICTSPVSSQTSISVPASAICGALTVSVKVSTFILRFFN